RRTGRRENAAVAERHEYVAKIAPQRERQAAEGRQQNAVPPADAAEIPQAAGRHEREQYEAGPDEPVQRQNQRRQSDQDSVARGNKAERPKKGRAGAAQHAQRCRVFNRQRWSKGHSAANHSPLLLWTTAHENSRLASPNAK